MTATRYSTRHSSRSISTFTIRTTTWREAYESSGACVEILIGYIHRWYLLRQGQSVIEQTMGLG
jgi:hypothetical protein